METEKITAQEATEKGIQLYGEAMVIRENTNGKVNSDMLMIADSEMFGECIFCQMEEKVGRNADSLNEIQKILEDDFLDYNEKKQNYRLTELIPSKNTKEVMLFMRIAYIAFHISQDDLSFLKAFVELQAMNLVSELQTDDKLENVTKNLGEKWDIRILNLYKEIFPVVKKRHQNMRGEHLHLGVICESLKVELDNMKHKKF